MMTVWGVDAAAPAAVCALLYMHISTQWKTHTKDRCSAQTHARVHVCRHADCLHACLHADLLVLRACMVLRACIISALVLPSCCQNLHHSRERMFFVCVCFVCVRVCVCVCARARTHTQHTTHTHTRGGLTVGMQHTNEHDSHLANDTTGRHVCADGVGASDNWTRTPSDQRGPQGILQLWRCCQCPRARRACGDRSCERGRRPQRRGKGSGAGSARRCGWGCGRLCDARPG